MNLPYSVMASSLKGITGLLCEIDGEQLQNVPTHGPLILVCNHINFLEAPVVVGQLQPRVVTAFAKSETWDNPFLAALFNLFGAIPLRRGEADMVALKQGLKALEQGKILAITPEGTRSGHGRLQKGHPGVTMMALHSQAPILPLVYWGGEAFYQNISRLHRTPFIIRVGKLYRLDTCGERITREVRQAMTDEIMTQLAQLMPAAYRGAYADHPITTHYLKELNP